MRKRVWRYKAGAGLMALMFAVSGSFAANAKEISGPAAALEASKQAEEAEKKEATEEEIDAYFDGTVLVGDSVMMGFRNYAMRHQDTYLSRIGFLAAGSFSVNNSLWPVNAESVHPVYQGQKRHVWESISMMGARRVFLFFGLNDLNINGLEGTCEKYKELIAKIREESPDAEIHLMSMTYTLKDKGIGKLNNDSIRRFNLMLSQMAAENGWGFVDIASPLADENGDLAADYCSDGFVHQTPAAYGIWSSVLRTYARDCLEGRTATPSDAQTTADNQLQTGNK
ncbi:MAG: GDSL-type esterase/lipase family protein [Enterocloster sp.]